MTATNNAGELRFAAALSTAQNTQEAVQEVCSAAREQLQRSADLAFLFVSQQHGPDYGQIATAVCDAVGTENLLGCTGESIVGGDREIEGQPAVSLWLAHLPGVSISPMHLQFAHTAEGATFTGWTADLPELWPPGAALLLLGEPFSFPADALIERLNEDRRGIPVLGGMASGGWNPGQNRLLLGRQELDSGAVAALIHGPVRIRSVVSQGCRPIGRTFVITKAEQNVIYELGGMPAMQRLSEVFGELSPADQELVRLGLHVGRVLSEYKEHFSRGDFLIRNVVGADPNAGAIAVGDYVRAGQTVQFHVRDSAAADEDLRELLLVLQDADVSGALLFTCNGRGTRLFPEPDHDAACVRERLGKIPLAGFFAQGELGPVSGKNFLHGFTASVALFGPAEATGP